MGKRVGAECYGESATASTRRRAGPWPDHEKTRRADGEGRLDKGGAGRHSGGMDDERYRRLAALLRGYGSCLVAYSGGVDSALLAVVARRELGGRMLAAIADSPSLARRELAEALELAACFDVPVRVVRTEEFGNPAYTANPSNRCYYCKHELFTRLAPLARAEGFAVIAYGENASDAGDHRPGAQAAAEFQVRAPLKEAGLSKADIRALSAALGLPTADKPQLACLSSRIPYGEVVAPEKLRMIEAAENALRNLGFHDVRVRHHELKQGALARLELGPAELPRLADAGLAARAAAAVQAAGYRHATLDLLGYRRGSLNEPPAAARPAVAGRG